MFKISLVINENFGKLTVILFPPKEIIQLCIFSSPKKKKKEKEKERVSFFKKKMDQIESHSLTKTNPTFQPVR